MLTLTNLGKSYRTSEIETRALDAISLEVAAGEFLAIMGPSGCGKSTLLNILGCLDRASDGSYRLMGEEVAHVSEAKLTQLRRAHIGFVFQSFNLIDDLTVAENVEVALLYRQDGGSRKARIAEALERVGMAHRARHRPRQLSGGQQQRVAIARALVSNPKLILADEPTGNLDTANGKAVMDLLNGISGAGATIIMVTHSPAHAAVARRTVRMLDGRIVSETQV
ncbi:ABC transporter ATP-binding protein [Nitrospirillum iridis]|uniref:Putative ABC transport system ATP-binding protein n=1 Tax=Nitrospirillum iridis TaxID=765888 RepID=A0A7X0B5Z8_9PROT|nr:ABC transporter ATP-binding protein [Nitrospirillum iridis]MBB6255081.1 putative ABC transport system ATP-binding protein [Nitrospirillum iridis]